VGAWGGKSSEKTTGLMTKTVFENKAKFFFSNEHNDGEG
jgi:hypothetical protein